MSTAAARVAGATKVYGEGEAAVRALDDLTVEFEQGRFTAIMGPSGSGKSTLLHCVAGLDTLTEGSAFIGDVRLGDLKEKDLTLLRRDKVGFIFQAFNLIPTLDAGENITLPIDIAGGDTDQEWFDTVVGTIGVDDRLSHRPSELSGGQQQRVAAARALVSRPAIVFADEYGQTIVMVTHDPNAAAYADRIVFLADGGFAGEMLDPTADQVFEHLKSMGD
jgi:putative ABC transport system ATP-binding protein